MNGNKDQSSMTIVAIIGSLVVGVLLAVCAFAFANRSSNQENVSPACPGYNTGMYSGLQYMSDPFGSVQK